MSITLDKIRAEHMSMKRVLDCLADEVHKAREEERELDLDLLRSIVTYMRDFPDKFHHPKEDGLLFPAVLRHSPTYEDVIADLREEHRKGEELLGEMSQLIAKCADNTRDSRKAFERVAKAYVAFESNHMRKEETTVIPIARSKLTDEDWAAIDAEFLRNQDPLQPGAVEKAFEALFRKIAILTSPPK